MGGSRRRNHSPSEKQKGKLTGKNYNNGASSKARKNNTSFHQVESSTSIDTSEKALP
jgi:hypothetical protein